MSAKAEPLPLLRVANLSRQFDVSAPWVQRLFDRSGRKVVTAVGGIDFAIPKGTTFSLVGESGCGKSTVARLIAGLEAPSEGTITFSNGQPKLQMVFQDPVGSLNPRWRIGRSIAEPLARTLTKAQRAARVEQLLQTVSLTPDDADKYPHEFSGGQRQRISIARALAADAELLLLDEPTSALDVSVQAQVLNLLKDLQARLGLTYLFISHNLAVVRFLTDRVGVMYLGRLVEEGPGEVVLQRPLHPYTQLLLKTVPDLENPRRDRVPVSSEVPSPLNPPLGCAFHPRCPIAFDRCRHEHPVMLRRPDGTGVACHAVAASP
jgi:peptide/nickel transport system ATP-binding protein